MPNWILFISLHQIFRNLTVRDHNLFLVYINYASETAKELIKTLRVDALYHNIYMFQLFAKLIGREENGEFT